MANETTVAFGKCTSSKPYHTGLHVKTETCVSWQAFGFCDRPLHNKFGMYPHRMHAICQDWNPITARIPKPRPTRVPVGRCQTFRHQTEHPYDPLTCISWSPVDRAQAKNSVFTAMYGTNPHDQWDMAKLCGINYAEIERRVFAIILAIPGVHEVAPVGKDLWLIVEGNRTLTPIHVRLQELGITNYRLLYKTFGE